MSVRAPVLVAKRNTQVAVNSFLETEQELNAIIKHNVELSKNVCGVLSDPGCSSLLLVAVGKLLLLRRTLSVGVAFHLLCLLIKVLHLWFWGAGCFLPSPAVGLHSAIGGSSCNQPLQLRGGVSSLEQLGAVPAF